MAKATKAERQEARRACAIVGELVLTASALDHQLNRICISALALVECPMLEPMVASLDSARKIEILRAFSTKIAAPQWRKAIRDHAETVEKVNRARNTAAHSVLSFQKEKAVLSSPAAAKLLRSIDLTTMSADRISLGKLEAATRAAEKALGVGENLLMNLRLVATKRANLQK